MATPSQVVSYIQDLTQKSQALQAPAQYISIINGPLITIGQGPLPEIITGLSEVVSTSNTAISHMQNMPPIAAGAQSDAVFDAFCSFAKEHQALLNILTGKAGLFNTVPVVGQPVAAVLRQVESAVDTIAFTLIDAVENRASDLQAQADALSGSLDAAISSYDGLSSS